MRRSMQTVKGQTVWVLEIAVDMATGNGPYD
jgi:hypothetical protein